MSDLREAALSSKAWPFEEARKLAKRYKEKAPEKGKSPVKGKVKVRIPAVEKARGSLKVRAKRGKVISPAKAMVKKKRLHSLK